MKICLSRRLITVMLVIVALSIATELGLTWHYVGDKPRPDISDPNLLRIPHPERGWTIEPDASALLFSPLYSTYLEYNARGLRGKERAYRAAPGVYRILLLGDSFLEGYQHADNDLFASQLEDALAHKSVEVINLSVGGYGTTQQYLYLRDEGLKYQPDLIVLAFQPGNDIRDNSRTLLELYKRNLGLNVYIRPYATIRDEQTIEVVPPPPAYIATYKIWREQSIISVRSSRFWDRLLTIRYLRARFGRERAPKLNPNLHYGAYLDNFDPALFIYDVTAEQYEAAWNQGWETTRQLILSIARLAGQSGAQFTVLNLPARIQADRAYLRKTQARYPSLRFDLDRIDRKAEQFAGTHVITMLNLTPVFRAYNERHDKSLFLGEEDQHWNRNGQRLAAETVAEHVESCLLMGKNCPSVVSHRP